MQAKPPKLYSSFQLSNPPLLSAMLCMYIWCWQCNLYCWSFRTPLLATTSPELSVGFIGWLEVIVHANQLTSEGGSSGNFAQFCCAGSFFCERLGSFSVSSGAHGSCFATLISAFPSENTTNLHLMIPQFSDYCVLTSLGGVWGCHILTNENLLGYARNETNNIERE